MATEFGSFNFIGTLAAVINGLGIVRWLTSLADYLKRKDSMAVRHYWVYSLAALFQFVLHIFLWWSLWSIRSAESLTFFSYLYMLIGPILMFLGSAFLAPDIEGDRLNLRQQYYSARPIYTTLLFLVWLWAAFASPVFRGVFTDSASIFVMLMIIALAMRVEEGEMVQRTGTILNWIIMFVFVLFFGNELGGLAPILDLDFDL